MNTKNQDDSDTVYIRELSQNKQETRVLDPSPYCVSLDAICNPVEVRRCRFMASVPAAAVVDPPRPGPGGPEPLPSPDKELECERGRVVDEASFGKAFVPFREFPLGAPEALFLRGMSIEVA